jgi:hypothetical protein
MLCFHFPNSSNFSYMLDSENGKLKHLNFTKVIVARIKFRCMLSSVLHLPDELINNFIRVRSSYLEERKRKFLLISSMCWMHVWKFLSMVLLDL